MSGSTIHIGNKSPVVAGMATMPSRLESFQQALNSILPQVDRLYLFLDRFEHPYQSLDPRVIVVESGRFGDLRANGKLFGLNLEGRHSYYFPVDDDICYPPDYVETMIEFLDRHSRQFVAGVHGSIFKPGFERYLSDRVILHRSGELTKPVRVDVLGTCTAAFHTGRLNFDVRDWATTNMVDLNFALECARRKITRVAVSRDAGWIRCIGEFQEDSIFTALKDDDTVQTELARELISLSAEGHEAG